jgi:kumamolisin
MKFCVALCTAALLFSGEAQAQKRASHTKHVRQEVSSGEAKFLRRMPTTETLRLHVVLPVRDQAGLDQFLKDVSDPSSPSYRHFLTVPEFTERFGPTQADYDELTQFATSNGFRLVGGSRDGMDLQIEGSISAIERAFNVTMGVYQVPGENSAFYSADREPTMDLNIQVWHISGLDNHAKPHPMYVSKTAYAAANGISPDAVVSHATTGSGPSASFLGSDMRAAYYGGTALTGAGQSLGLFEYYGTDLADVTTYYTNANQTNNVPITLLSTDGTSTACVDTKAGGSCDDTEQTLDITQALGMAPGLSSLVVYVGSTDTAIISAMTTHSPLPLTIGCSWGWTPADPTSLNPYFQKMAAQGQSFFVASGDNSTWTKTGNAAAWPADSQYVIAVGGTDLVTSGAGGAWASETAWADSGGGISPDGIAIPSWQQLAGVITSTNKGSTTLRNGPDVSANANFTFYVCANQTACTANGFGGTSFAAPMWAGYVALANQQAAASGKSPVGFLNPTIYAQNLTSSYGANFHDVTSGTSGSYSATTGFDLVTGWGSPNGANLINALVSGTSTPTPAFTISAAPTTVSVVQGASGASTITTAVSGGFSSAVALTASGQPSGVTASLSLASIAAPGSGTSTLTLAVTSTVAAGNYTITVTGTGGGLTHTATVTLTVTAAPVPAFAISAAPTTVSVVQGASGTSTITTTVSGGFNGAVALTASGAPTGVTASFSPASIAAPGSGKSTLTIAAASTVAAGNYTITVTGTNGTTSHTAGVTLTVTAAAVPAFTISAAPTSVSVAQGASGTSTITSSVSGGFNGAVALTASGQPTGVTVSFSPASIAAPGSGTSTVTLAVASTVATGSYAITVSGKNGTTTHTANVTLTVTSVAVPAFTISTAPGSVSAAPGASGTSTITSSVSGGFSGAVALTASGQPTGVTISFNPATIAAPGSGSSTMTMAVASTVAAGAYTITVSGKSGSTTHTASVTLTVTAPTGGAFTISVSPSAGSLSIGQSGYAVVSTRVSGGFDSAIALTATGQPTGVTVNFTPASIAAPGTGASDMNITVASTVATGTYPITVTGTGGGVTHTTTLTFEVTKQGGKH